MALLVLALAALLASPCLGSPSPLHSLLTSPEFSGFTRLLEQADVIPEIEAAFKEGAQLTVLAPSNDALVYRTSPTALAYLKQGQNKAALRQTLLSHFLTGEITPFHWEGVHRTLAGTEVALSFDANAYYAGDVAITKYNAIETGAEESSVHSIPGLMLLKGMELEVGRVGVAGVGDDMRRALLAAAPAPGPASAEEPVIPKENASPNGATLQAAASMVAGVGASLVALLFL